MTGLCKRCGGLTKRHYVTTSSYVYEAFCGVACARAYRVQS